MKRNFKKVLAVVLTLVMLSSTFVVSFAATELNKDAVAMHYGQYKNYVLLGDSIASGYRDEVTENDEAYNELHKDSTYYRYTGSYSDVLANAIIEDKSMTALAAPGFRTIEMRYMLEDDFAATCTDPYLFHTSHLYVYEDEVCPCHNVKMLPGSEHFRDEFKTSISEADLITLGIGGNDWGAYLTWVLDDLIEKEAPSDKYAEFAGEIAATIANGNLDMTTVEKLLEIAHYIGILPELLLQLPKEVDYGLTNFYKNWDIMIQDIYALNPDVTLMVVGMGDNGIKGKYYDYDGVVGGPVTGGIVGETEGAMKYVIDLILGIGNAPMIEGARKFGYTYVDTNGASYVDSHPDKDGHVFIANKIIEALPDPEVKGMFEDLKPGDKYYSAVEYVVANGIMTGLTETTFGADEAITSGQLNAAINAITGANGSTNSTAKAKMLEFALAMLTGGAKKGFVGFFKGVGLMMRVMAENSFNVSAAITRGEAANYLKDLAQF